jgi:hypothetical protein
MSRIGSRKAAAVWETMLVHEAMEYMGTLGTVQRRRRRASSGQFVHEQDADDISLE